MDIRPIRTEQDYSAALDRVGELMDAEPGTEAGDELDILTPPWDRSCPEHTSGERPTDPRSGSTGR